MGAWSAKIIRYLDVIEWSRIPLLILTIRLWLPIIIMWFQDDVES